jgi:hypothetical protein
MSLHLVKIFIIERWYTTHSKEKENDMGNNQGCLYLSYDSISTLSVCLPSRHNEDTKIMSVMDWHFIDDDQWLVYWFTRIDYTIIFIE